MEEKSILSEYDFAALDQKGQHSVELLFGEAKTLLHLGQGDQTKVPLDIHRFHVSKELLLFRRGVRRKIPKGHNLFALIDLSSAAKVFENQGEDSSGQPKSFLDLQG